LPARSAANRVRRRAERLVRATQPRSSILLTTSTARSVGSSIAIPLVTAGRDELAGTDSAIHGTAQVARP
jgi:hypothetical protein